MLTAPVQFLRHYLFHQNFRNGVPGLAWSLMNALGSVLKYLKARELELREAQETPTPPRAPRDRPESRA